MRKRWKWSIIMALAIGLLAATACGAMTAGFDQNSIGNAEMATATEAQAMIFGATADRAANAVANTEADLSMKQEVKLVANAPVEYWAQAAKIVTTGATQLTSAAGSGSFTCATQGVLKSKPLILAKSVDPPLKTFSSVANLGEKTPVAPGSSIFAGKTISLPEAYALQLS